LPSQPCERPLPNTTSNRPDTKIAEIKEGGLDEEGELAAGEVLAGRTGGDPFEEPPGGVDRRPGAADVVEQ